MFRNFWHVALLAIFSATVSIAAPQWPQRPTGYEPVLSLCPANTPLLRPGNSISPQEAAYIAKRKLPAARALRKWIEGTGGGFDTRTLPTLALASSGGGYRAMLSGAGVVQAFDDDDSDSTTSGLYQALTYHSALSGGAWLLSSLIGNREDATVSGLKQELWDKALLKNSIYPTNTGTASEGPQIKADIAAKKASGYYTSLTDVWGRFLSYQLLDGRDGGVVRRLSNVPTHRKFQSAMMPFPIITALAKTAGINGTICDPNDDGAQFEFTPYDTGSWDQGISAFTPTTYLGTQLERGIPSKKRCVQNFDNLGFLLGTSSSKFQEACGASTISVIGSGLEPFLPNETTASTGDARRKWYANFPNPFYKNEASPWVTNDPELFLLDGGQANQNNPIWPFIQNYRWVDVVFVNDNSADTDDNWPNGTEILHTYQQAKNYGLAKMPPIASVSHFVSSGLNKRPAFFGCGDRSKLTIVWLPNAKYSFDSNVPTSKFEYTANETAAMIKNGGEVATQNGDEEWPLCLACGIMHKTAYETGTGGKVTGGKVLPEACVACLNKYCYVPV